MQDSLFYDDLQRRASRLNVNEIDEDQIERDDQSVEQFKVPMMRQVLPGDRIGLAVHCVSIGPGI